MKITLLISSFLIYSYFGLSQKALTDQKESIDMIQLCNSFTHIDIFGDDKDILPEYYTKVYTSDVYGLDNKYQIYTNDDRLIITFRGSTDKMESWLENMYAVMIPAEDSITLNGKVFNYKFAEDKHAAVHSGYALGIGFLIDDILLNINSLSKNDKKQLVITGHSQGGALANMLTAYLNNLPKEEIPNIASITTYAFAAPMVGNKEFVSEYNVRYYKTGISNNFINPVDPVPKLPISYNDTTYLSQNLKDIFTASPFNVKKMLVDGAMNIFGHYVNTANEVVATQVLNRINKDVAEVEMPEGLYAFNYTPIKYQYLLPISVYPDSTQKEPIMFQHAPYNYYTSMLRKFDTEAYENLEVKYLKETL